MVLKYTIKQGKNPLEARKKLFLAKKTGKFAKELDKALLSKYTKKLYDKLSRTQAALLVQVRSGYCRLNSYLYRISKAESSNYKCGAIENVRHFLLECA
jgi:hypothetical protein